MSTVVCGRFFFGGGGEQIQNGGLCHGNQGAKIAKRNVQRIHLKLDTKIDHRSKLCSLFKKFSKWPPFQNGHQYENRKNRNKLLKIQKWKDFNGNGYLHGVRHAAQYDDHFDLLWRPFWIQNGRQNTKSSNLGTIWFPSRLWCCELISIVWEPCYDPSDHIISCLYLRLRKVSHTIYTANGKVTHIHRRMCERDYTIDKSLVCLQSERRISC